jgi:glutaconate CoA-transferase subunit A
MDKRMSMAELVAAIPDGALVSFGGGGLQRKPMAAVKAIAASPIQRLRLAMFLGGPDADLLIGMGKAAWMSFAYVGFDLLGLAPNFRKAREGGTLPVVEYSEATAMAAFEAAAKRLPFLPTRFGLGTDVETTPTTPFKRILCPFTGATLLAVPATRPDIAILHVNEADRAGNGIIIGDAYIDPLIARAAQRTYLTAERIVDDLPRGNPGRRATFISRVWVNGVVEAPRGGGFTGVFPDYPADLAAALDYQANAADPAWLRLFVARQDGDAA